jgi:N-acyl-D-amino-acid deacylase
MYDLVIEGGRLLDGSGNPWVSRDLAVAGGRIAAIGRLRGASASRRIDAGGQYVCPGFVDIHSHSDRSLAAHNRGIASLRQGIATQVGGNCGISLAPRRPGDEAMARLLQDPGAGGVGAAWQTFSEYLDWQTHRGVGTNYVPLVGHGAVRRLVMGPEGQGGERSQPTAAELLAMQDEVRRAMAAGAWGLSTGLEYPPGRNASTSELVDLCAVVAEHDGLYATHLRSEGRAPRMEWWGAIVEALEIGRRSGVRVNISHLKADQRHAWDKTSAALQLLEDARRRGIEVSADLYPWPFAAVGYLYEILPPHLTSEGIRPLLARLADPAAREDAREAIERGIADWTNPALSFGWGAIGIVESGDEGVVGRSVEDVAAERAADPLDVVFDLLLRDRGATRSSAGVMSEANISRLLQHPLTMVSTDGFTVDDFPVAGDAAGSDAGFAPVKLHPRSVATYPRLLGHYVREQGILSLPEAVRKSTSLPAATIGLADRGRLEPGLWADVVVFDAATVGQVGSFADPHHAPRGINWVIVNGQVAVADGAPTGVLAGQVLRRGGGIG